MVRSTQSLTADCFTGLAERDFNMEINMTDKEFQHQFRRGIESAIVELRQNENRLKYKEIVYRCCLKMIR